MIFIVTAILLILIIAIRSATKADPKPSVIKKPTQDELDQAYAAIRKVITPAEIIEEVRTEPTTSWSDIRHMNDLQIIEIAGQLNKTQLRRWFNCHHKDYVHFPDKAYAFIQAKLNDQVWFSDEQYAEREAAGKRSTYLTQDGYLIEQFQDVFYNNAVGFKAKMAQINLLLSEKNKKIRLGNKISLFNVAYDKVKEKSLSEEDLKKLKGIKNMQTRAFNKLELKEDDINFKVLDEYLRLLQL